MKKEQKVIVIQSIDETTINAKISEMNKEGWIASNISISEASNNRGQIGRYTAILFESQALSAL